MLSVFEDLTVCDFYTSLIRENWLVGEKVASKKRPCWTELLAFVGI